MRHIRNKALILFMMLLLGCGGFRQPMPKIQYYTLEYEPPEFTGLTPLPAVVELEPFSVRVPYNSDRIVYRDGPFKRDAYLYARWRDNPGDLVTYFLGRDMKASGLFEAVITEPGPAFPSLRLRGAVNDFFEQDGTESWAAVLDLDLTLVSGPGDANASILLQKNYRFKETCEKKNPRGLAAAMSRAMSSASRTIIRDLHDYMKAADLPGKEMMSHK